MENEIEVVEVDSPQKKAYLSLLKKRLASYARQSYDYSAGGHEAVEQYNFTCIAIKKAKNLGEILRVAKAMQFPLSEAVQLILFPLVEGIEKEDLLDTPQTW